METILITSKTELAQTLREVLAEREVAREKATRTKSLTIHQVAKRLGRADSTIKKFVVNGTLKTTIDGRIPEVELERFLNQK
jgi:ParB-like chromosome segregation protein Spo0J